MCATRVEAEVGPEEEGEPSCLEMTERMGALLEL